MFDVIRGSFDFLLGVFDVLSAVFVGIKPLTSYVGYFKLILDSWKPVFQFLIFLYFSFGIFNDIHRIQIKIIFNYEIINGSIIFFKSVFISAKFS